MRRSADFSAAVRGGRRSARPTLVLHVRSRPDCAEAARIGFVVSKAVGNSVVRHRVVRRLRGVCAADLGRWRAGDLVVIRALPKAADATSEQLSDDLDRAAGRLTVPVASGAGS
jgi:ribonuclease P protein component